MQANQSLKGQSALCYIKDNFTGVLWALGKDALLYVPQRLQKGEVREQKFSIPNLEVLPTPQDKPAMTEPVQPCSWWGQGDMGHMFECIKL